MDVYLYEFRWVLFINSIFLIIGKTIIFQKFIILFLQSHPVLPPVLLLILFVEDAEKKLIMFYFSSLWGFMEILSELIEILTSAWLVFSINAQLK